MGAKVIALSGPHGTGKSAAAFDLAGDLKRAGGGEVGLIQEVARTCQYPILGAGSRSTEEAQRWMFVTQIKREMDACRLYDRVVTDRSVVDYIAYSSVLGFHGLAAAQLAMARQHVEIYAEIRFHGAAEFPFMKDDGTRHTDPAVQAEVQARMLELYAELGIRVRRILP